MQVQCSHCNVNLKFDETKIDKDSVTITCPKCKEKFTVDLKPPPEDDSLFSSEPDNMDFDDSFSDSFDETNGYGNTENFTSDTKAKKKMPMENSMGDIQTNHQLIAIRMKWLGRLKEPLQALWDFVIDSLMYAWDITRLAWKGMKSSLNPRYWIIASIAGVLSVFLVLLFAYLGNLFKVKLLISIGGLLAVLPFAWAYAEIAGALKYKEDNGRDVEYSQLKSIMGTGIKAISNVGLYVAVFIAMIAVQIILDLLGKIPHAGPVLLSIFIIPLIAASAIAILSLVILTFGMPLLGSHLVLNTQEDKGFIKNFMSLSSSLIRVISKKWLDVILISIPMSFFAIVLSLLPAALLGGSIGLTSTIITVVTGKTGALGASMLKTFPMLFAAKGALGYVSGFFMVISFAVLIGIVMSMAVSSYASTYYALYTYERDISFFKKIVGLLIFIGIAAAVMSFFGISSATLMQLL
jgi:hypothetical protein